MPRLATMLVAVIAYPAVSQATPSSQTFNCIYGDDTNGFQPWVVPAGVTGITATLQGAAGSHPGKGSRGGFGGQTQGDLTVTPGQTLNIIVGCTGNSDVYPVGWGFGGDVGVASFSASGNGGYGGGGSAVLLADGLTPLLVAGGGGGGGGDGARLVAGGGNGAASESDPWGGVGGNGGILPQPGSPGGGTGGGIGGCVNCQPQNEINGLDGWGSRSAGGGGGGGGGFPGGGGGHGGDVFAGGGGGGGGTSYAAPSVTNVSFGTSQLSGDGLVVLTWSTALGPTSVPEPSAVSLLMTALAGLAVVRARRRRSAGHP